MKGGVDRSAYNRSDALNAIAYHMNRMLQHRAEAAAIAKEFGLDLPLPEKKPMLETLSIAAKLKHQKPVTP